MRFIPILIVLHCIEYTSIPLDTLNLIKDSIIFPKRKARILVKSQDEEEDRITKLNTDSYHAY